MKLFLVTGSIGSGKTLVLKELYSKLFKRYKTVLIVHEAGYIGMDGTFLIQNNIPAISYPYSRVAPNPDKAVLDNIESARHNFSPNFVLSEVSGVVSTPYILNLFRESSEKTVGGVIYVADCSSFLKDYKRDHSFISTQVLWADYIILNKEDRIDPRKKAIILKLLREINPVAFIYETRYGILTQDFLKHLAEKIFSREKSVIYKIEISDLYSNAKLTRTPLNCRLLSAQGSTEPQRIVKFLNAYKEQIFRAKGFFLTGYGMCFIQLSRGFIDYKFFDFTSYANNNRLSLILPLRIQEKITDDFSNIFVP